MSTICGIIQLDQFPDASRRCCIVQAALEPYGRHAQGLWNEPRVALGSRLTRLLPEDQYDHQPLHGGNGKFVLVADVRLDNRSELAHKLGISLVRLEVMADADVLLAAYEKWEQQLLDHLIGDFAFAVWDKQQHSLFLARDHMGRRPLFYHQGNSAFAFASMPAGLLALPDVPMAPDQERVRHSLCLLPDSADNSYFSRINRLLPGHCATLCADGKFHTREYWRPPTEERIQFKSDDAYVEGFLDVLKEAVRCRLRSSGSIATQLSAGFDSSTITSIAAHQLQDAGQSVHAFTSIPNPSGLPPEYNRVLDEGPRAAQISRLFPNIQHHLVRTDDQSIINMLQQMFTSCNRPAINVINLLYYTTIAQLAAKHGATTLLTGELGNFTISYHGSHILNSLLRDKKNEALLQQLYWRLKDKSSRRKLAIIRDMLMPSMPVSIQELLEKFLYKKPVQNSLSAGINPSMLNRHPHLRRHLQKLDKHQNIQSTYTESRMWRANLLRKNDPAELNKGILALAGIDLRDPTADIRLIRYCQAIPVEQYRHNDTDRWLLRRAMQRYWPQEIISSRVKGVQGADWQLCVAAEQRQLLQEIQQQKNSPEIEQLLDVEWMEKQLSNFSKNHNENNAFTYTRLLRCIAAGHFLRNALDKERQAIP
ncbi:asparagine synthetase B family protein [Pseudomonas sp. LRF_L74]|uniref:asparagine synthetase B family protein n=1 Tax=Pseudomonas sp. LRF_L74 TaxID=3369422 RepID=UPI003F61CC5C